MPKGPPIHVSKRDRESQAIDETRSRIMRSVRQRDTGPELNLRRSLHARGLRFRLHARYLPGRPDIVLPKWKAVIFVNGCFWHRHEDCRYATTPRTRGAYWQAKFDANKSRDGRNKSELLTAGWRVAVVWECHLRTDGSHRMAERVHAWLRTDSEEFESENE